MRHPFQSASRLATLLFTAAGCVVLLGWTLDVAWLKNLPGLALLVAALVGTSAIFLWLNSHRLKESENRRRDTLETMIEGCQIIGFDWKYVYINAAAIAQSQRTRETLLGYTMQECYPGIETTPLFATLRRCMEHREPDRLVNEFVYPDGTKAWFELSIQPSQEGILILSSDITRQHLSQEAAHEQQSKLATVIGLLPVGVAIMDSQRNVLYSNPALKEVLQISNESLEQQDYSSRRYIRGDGSPMPVEELASFRALKEDRIIEKVETGVARADGVIWTMVSAVPVSFPDWKVVVVTTDITAKKAAETEILKLNAELEEGVRSRTAELAEANEQLRKLSLFDALTGLYNRRGFEVLGAEKLNAARRTQQRLLCIFADLDNLKTINDERGHSAGDEAIVAVARALEETFRSSDIKARLGGDEFIVLAVQSEDTNAQAPIDRFHKLLAQSQLSVSVGLVSVGPDTHLPLADLIARADEAMYIEKRNKPRRR